MIHLKKFRGFLDNYLQVQLYKDDVGPNGLFKRGTYNFIDFIHKVSGKEPIRKVFLSVNLYEKTEQIAIREGADALITHHPNEQKGNDLAPKLLTKGILLFTYHLPLDAHPVVGNNVQIVNRIKDHLRIGQPSRFKDIGYKVDFEDPEKIEDLYEVFQNIFGKKWIQVENERSIIRNLAVVAGTGGDAKYINACNDGGIDCLLTGEIENSESAKSSLNTGVTVFYVGHEESEVFSLDAIAQKIMERFPEIETKVIN